MVNPIEALICGEGLCQECREQKPLAMVRLTRGEAVGLVDPTSGRWIPMPRVGFCEPCARRLAKEGRFGRKGRKGKGKG